MADEPTTWEYNVLQLPYNTRARTEALDKVGREGWMLVSVTHEGQVAFASLRRPARQQPQPEAPA